MTRARDLADLASAADAGTVAGQSLIINGDMAVAQRGTSATSLGNGNSGYHTVDRFRFDETGAPTCQYTMSQSTEAPDGFGYSLKLECTTADTTLASADALEVRTRLEGQDLQIFKKGTANHQKMALSFWVRSDKTGTYTVGLIDKDNSNRITSKSYSIDTADTWEYKSIIFDGEDTYAFTNDNGRSLDIGWYLGAGSNFTSGTLATTWQADDNADRVHSSQVNLSDTVGNEWYITGVKLEVGSATPFQHESYAENLAKCQRYFQKIESLGSVSSYNAFPYTGLSRSSTVAKISCGWEKSLRSQPTVSISAASHFAVVNGSGSAKSVTSTSVVRTREHSAMIEFTATGLTAGQATYLTTNNTADPAISVDAEL